MSNDNDTSILKFPVQKIDWDSDMTDMEMIQNIKLSAVRLLNLKAAGKYQFTLENIKSIKIVNDICLNLGYPPIVEDISQL